MFKDKRVEMVKGDSWARKGWTGVVVIEDINSVIVEWDNGKRLSHRKCNVRIISETTFSNNPNRAFVLHKQRLRKKAQKENTERKLAAIKKKILYVPTTSEIF